MGRRYLQTQGRREGAGEGDSRRAALAPSNTGCLVLVCTPLHFMTTMLSVVLAHNPQLIYSTGFQLSVIAVFRILLLTKPLKSPRAHLAQAAKKSTGASVEPHLRLCCGPASDISHSRSHLRGGLHRRGVHQPHCRAAIWADPDPRLPWLSGRKHLALARLPFKRLQRLSGHHPDTERQGRLLAPRGVGNDPRCNAAPGRLVLLRLRSRRPRLLKRTRVPVGRALLLIWSALWLVLFRHRSDQTT